MERIFAEEVFRAMQRVGWGEYTQPQPKTHTDVTKPPEIGILPNSSQCRFRQISMQGVTYSDGKKIIGHDLGIERFNTEVYRSKKLSELRQKDMKR